MNHHDGAAWRVLRRSTVAGKRGALVSSLTCVALGHAGIAKADLTFAPQASVRYQHESNVFALPDDGSASPPGRPPGSPRSDSSYVFTAGLGSTYAWDRQTLSLDLVGTRTNYDRFSDLNNTGYTGQAILNWALGSRFDGDLGYRRDRHMSSFANQQSSSTQLQIETSQTVNADVNVKLTPDWFLQPGVVWRDVNSPQAGFPDAQLKETSSSLGLKYAGLGRLTFTLMGNYTDGSYHGITGSPTYQERGAQLKSNYEITDVTYLNGAIGYSKREQEGSAPSSAITGGLGYFRQLTGKTSVNFNYARAINSYIAAGSSEVDDTLSAGVQWNATYKTSLHLEYAYTHADFDGDVVTNSLSVGRKDKVHDVKLTANYVVFRWLYISPYGRYQKRESNKDNFSYRDTIWGVDIGLRKPTQ